MPACCAAAGSNLARGSASTGTYYRSARSRGRCSDAPLESRRRWSPSRILAPAFACSSEIASDIPESSPACPCLCWYRTAGSCISGEWIPAGFCIQTEKGRAVKSFCRLRCWWSARSCHYSRTSFFACSRCEPSSPSGCCCRWTSARRQRSGCSYSWCCWNPLPIRWIVSFRCPQRHIWPGSTWIRCGWFIRSPGRRSRSQPLLLLRSALPAQSSGGAATLPSAHNHCQCSHRQ